MHIGVVEDNPAVLSMIETALTLHGHSVETYSKSSSFLSALEKTERVPAFDLVLVDLFLDERSGTDLVEALQAAPESHSKLGPRVIPTILISATEESILAPVRKRYPNLPILRKPFKVQDLVALINKTVSF